MKHAYFADTFYFLAVLNKNDPAYERALEFGQRHNLALVTTWPVLTELADAFVERHWRRRVIVFLDKLLVHPSVTVLPPSEEQYLNGLRLYADRPDKSWSLTDCISFVVMGELHITEALTGDKHFEQAGFTALFRM